MDAITNDSQDSAFPFRLDNYDDLDTLNEGLGFRPSGEVIGFAGRKYAVKTCAGICSALP